MVQPDGLKVRTVRVGHGWSQLDLADRCGVRQGTISNIENGASCRPSTLRRIADALGVTVPEVTG